MSELLYDTETVCPICTARLEGCVLVRDGAVYLEKTCPEHGDFSVKVDPDAEVYRKRLELFSTDPPPKFGELENFHLYLTDRCNLACPICFTDRNDKPRDLTFEEIMTFLDAQPALKKVALLGGEPSLREDLVAIVEAIKTRGGEPVICTNGLRFADPAFARRVWEAGLREVHLQFDGTDDAVYRKLRSVPLASRKRQALDVLAVQGFKVILLMTVERGTNDGALWEVLELARQRPEIRGLIYRAVGASGTVGGKEHGAEDLFPTDLCRALEQQSGQRIRSRDVETFQGIAMKLVRLFGGLAPGCLKDRFYVLVRSGGDLVPIGEILDLERLDALLDLVRAPTVSGLLRSLNPFGYLKSRDPRALMALARFALMQVSSERKTGFTEKGGVFVLGFAGLCDRYNYDKLVVETCTSSLFMDGSLYRKLPEGFVLSNVAP